jgi:hypothetical protein
MGPDADQIQPACASGQTVPIWPESVEKTP